MKEFWIFLFISLILKINCQDGDYDTEPDDIDQINDFASNEPAQPEFFKNAFNENSQSNRQIHSLPDDNGLNNYLNLSPNLGEGRSSFSILYPPFIPNSFSMNTQSTPFQSNVHEQHPRSGGLMNDFFSHHHSHNNKGSNEVGKPAFDSINKYKSSNEYSNNGYSPMMFNFGFPSSYTNPSMNGRFNSYQNQYPISNSQPHHLPPGAHLFPYTQRKKNDEFNEELKSLGIDLSELGLDSGEDNSAKEEKPKKEKKKKEKEKKKRPLLSLFRTTTTESPVQNQYLKSNVDNDINNLGFNMNDYGIKEHKLEKQVYGNEVGKYQYPMQTPLPNMNKMINQNNAINQHDLVAFKSLNNLPNDLNQYSEDKLNSLLKLNPSSNDQTSLTPLMPFLDSDTQNIENFKSINPVFTSADNSLSNSNGLNDIATINLLENNFNDLNSFSGKAHEYQHTNNIPENINENFKPFIPNKVDKPENVKPRPKFLDTDPFFKDEKPNQLKNDDEESNYEPVDRKKLKKVVYKINSDVKSSRYFESVTPSSKLTTYSLTHSDSESDTNDYRDDKQDKTPKYNDERNDEKSSDIKSNDDRSNDDRSNDDRSNDERSNHEVSNDDKSDTYNKEYVPSQKYKFGYRFYGQNNHPDNENKKVVGQTMKLVSDDSESNEKESTDKTTDDDQSNARSVEPTNNNQDENRVTESNEPEENNETNSNVKEVQKSNKNLKEDNSNEEYKSSVEDEFSGSRKKRSISNGDYFRSVDRRLMDQSNKNIKMSYNPFIDHSFIRRQDALNNDFDEIGWEDELIDELNRSKPVRKNFYTLNNHKESPVIRIPKLHQDEQTVAFHPIKKAQRRKIVNFDSSDDYSKKNFDTSLLNDYIGPSRKRQKYFQNLKKEYDDEFNLKELRSRFIPRIERRKSCSHSSDHLKYLNKIYNRDDTDHYGDLSRNPMYKYYQHL